MSCGVGRRRSLDPELLWLWCRPTARDPIRPLAWEPPYAMGSGPRKGKKTKNKQTNKPKQKKTEPDKDTTKKEKYIKLHVEQITTSN